MRKATKLDRDILGLIPQSHIVPEALQRQIACGVCWVCGHDDSPLDVWAICLKCRERHIRMLALIGCLQ